VAAARLRGPGHKAGALAPRKAQGRGKIERFFRTVREQFLVEIVGQDAGGSPAAGTAVSDLTELNRLFSAWVQAGYHQDVHSETGQPPAARWAAGAPDPLPLPSPAQLREAFLWSERRTVRKTATVSLHGNSCQVDPCLVRRTVELVFDPFDLTSIEVRLQGKPAGKAVPFSVGRHAHVKARDAAEDGARRDEPAPTGIDYLKILDAAHGEQLKAQINYAALITPAPSGEEDGDG
jgi:putative transposase